VKQPEYQGAGWAIHNSDCIEGMHAMPERSIDCAVFSPRRAKSWEKCMRIYPRQNGAAVVCWHCGWEAEV
jgi:hypothetical protein